MDDNASESASGVAVTTAAAAAAAAAGRNTTSSTSSLVQSQTSSLLIFAFVNSATTLVCACLTAVCVLSGLGLGLGLGRVRVVTSRHCSVVSGWRGIAVGKSTCSRTASVPPPSHSGPSNPTSNNCCGTPDYTHLDRGYMYKKSQLMLMRRAKASV